MKKITLSPHTKDVLELVGSGVLIASVFLFPGAGIGIHAIYKAYKSAKRESQIKNWEKYNLLRLRFILRRLQKQKLVHVLEDKGETVIQLTRKGKLKQLKYRLEDMKIEKQNKWDGKWRIIMYDISKFKRKEQAGLHRMFKKLNLYQLQKSVYLTPYPCDNEIEFLREYFNVSEGVLYIIAHKIENEEVYRRYFGV